jgi:hypothetical protein
LLARYLDRLLGGAQVAAGRIEYPPRLEQVPSCSSTSLVVARLDIDQQPLSS